MDRVAGGGWDTGKGGRALLMHRRWRERTLVTLMDVGVRQV